MNKKDLYIEGLKIDSIWILKCINCGMKKYAMPLGEINSMKQVDKVSHCCSKPYYIGIDLKFLRS